MADFKLDPRLAGETTIIGELSCCLVLLIKNKQVPWFVLVPKVANVSELYELDKATQECLLQEINFLSLFVKNNFKIDKLNVAAIGNIVNQLHVHIVGRDENDCAWPGVVWGMQQHTAYTEEEIDKIIHTFDLYRQDNE